MHAQWTCTRTRLIEFPTMPLSGLKRPMALVYDCCSDHIAVAAVKQSLQQNNMVSTAVGFCRQCSKVGWEAVALC